MIARSQMERDAFALAKWAAATATPRDNGPGLRSRRRAPTVAIRRVTTTHCGAPTAGRHARNTTAARHRAELRCSTPVVAVPARVAAAVVAPVLAVAGADAAAVVDAAVVAAGADRETDNMKNIRQTLSVLIATLAVAAAPIALAQKAYPTPEAAADALVDAMARHDGDALKSRRRPGLPKVHSRRKRRSRRRHQFPRGLGRGHKIVPAGNDRAYLGAGCMAGRCPFQS